VFCVFCVVECVCVRPGARREAPRGLVAPRAAAAACCDCRRPATPRGHHERRGEGGQASTLCAAHALSLLSCPSACVCALCAVCSLCPLLRGRRAGQRRGAFVSNPQSSDTGGHTHASTHTEHTHAHHTTVDYPPLVRLCCCVRRSLGGRPTQAAPAPQGGWHNGKHTTARRWFMRAWVALEGADPAAHRAFNLCLGCVCASLLCRASAPPAAWALRALGS
jgi:hypothetical protein